MVKQWMIPPPVPGLAAAARRWAVPPLVAQLLVNRGIAPEQGAEAFLTPRLKDLHPPDQLPGTSKAAEMIMQAIRSKDKILLYGDYDVDGTAGVAILWHVLRLGGAQVSFYVPHRIAEGYGLNAEAAERLAKEGAQVIVTVDCGITAVAVADRLVEAGVDLIVTDHHARQETLPRAAAIVHPAVSDSALPARKENDYPNPHLSGAGVAFKLAWAVAQRLSGAERVDPVFRDLLTELLPLAALGTIADVVPLTGENRTIAKHGLSRLIRTSLPGLRALIESAGLTGRRISDYDVGFKLAPRINAAGRMGHARLAVELFTCTDPDRAREIAIYLEDHNRTRRAAERKILKEADDIVKRHNLAGDARRAIVLASEEWHTGVIGIVAARMVARYRRPTVMIGLAGGEGQGSARSIPHFDLTAALGTCREHLVSYGGHAMAAGLRLAADRVASFAEAFVQVANHRLTGDDLVEKLRLDAVAALAELTLPTVEVILALGPFGVSNPKPRFATDFVELAQEPRRVGANQEHLQASFRQEGACIKAIGFGQARLLEDLKEHRRCRVAFEPIINDFNGRRTVEMQIIDLRFP